LLHVTSDTPWADELYWAVRDAIAAGASANKIKQVIDATAKDIREGVIAFRGEDE
jgi:hypothetical protein